MKTTKSIITVVINTHAHTHTQYTQHENKKGEKLQYAIKKLHELEATRRLSDEQHEDDYIMDECFALLNQISQIRADAEVRGLQSNNYNNNNDNNNINSNYNNNDKNNNGIGNGNRAMREELGLEGLSKEDQRTLDSQDQQFDHLGHSMKRQQEISGA